MVLTPANCQDNLLRKIADCKLSFAELKQHASEINDLQVPKTKFVEKTGCKSWKEAGERYLAVASQISITLNFSAFIKFLKCLFLH